MTCACCGKELAILGVQHYPHQLNRKPDTLVECQNAACIVYRRTATTETHHERCADARREEKGKSA